MIEQGPTEQNIIKQAIRAGLPIPKKIAEAQELDFGLQFYLNAFYELESERVVGLDLGPIPRHAILNYARELGCDEEEFDDLYFFVRHLDVTFLKHRAKKNKS